MKVPYWVALLSSVQSHPLKHLPVKLHICEKNCRMLWPALLMTISFITTTGYKYSLLCIGKAYLCCTNLTQCIAVVNTSIVVFVLELYCSEYYDSHYCSYVVSSCGTFIASAPHSLADYHPLQARFLFVSSERLFVCLPCIIH